MEKILSGDQRCIKQYQTHETCNWQKQTKHYKAIQQYIQTGKETAELCCLLQKLKIDWQSSGWTVATMLGHAGMQNKKERLKSVHKRDA